jgi:hypothetical protein
MIQTLGRDTRLWTLTSIGWVKLVDQVNPAVYYLSETFCYSQGGLDVPGQYLAPDRAYAKEQDSEHLPQVVRDTVNP